eukprot:TRINITY_DN15387_c0_g1_i3.p1 TRINITY_DN15387_c0_g1~~TRINITY_DN15387_c0_g1_i3.p1  ORF type:complete len:133 (-),score=35.23 TRINITY_DN15387_c0_g1_i3:25-423(-)
MFNEIFGSQISGYESKPINKISFQENEALINLLREDNELGMEDEEEMRSPECPQGWKSFQTNCYYLNPSSWTWSDGTAMNYTAWAREQPNNYWWGERCVRSVESFDRVGEQTWDDHKCWSRNALALVCKLQM